MAGIAVRYLRCPIIRAFLINYRGEEIFLLPVAKKVLARTKAGLDPPPGMGSLRLKKGLATPSIKQSKKL